MSYEFWMGSETSYKTHVDSMLQATQMRAAGTTVSDSPILDIQDGVAVISINGSLITSGNEYTSYFGLVGYNQIRDALITAAEDPEAKSILLDINSHGGSATGIGEIGDLISKINAEHKPVESFTSTNMHSAGLWLGVSAGKVSATRMADVGSIGCICTMFNYTGAMEKDGVKAYTFRNVEASQKALGGPFEEMTAEAKAVIQEKIDALGTEFINHVAQARNVSPAVLKATVATGKTFLGHEAAQLNLIDKVATIEEVVTRLKTASNTGKRVMMSTEGEPDMATKKKLLSEQSAALLAMGVPVEAALDAASDEPEQTEVPVEEAPAQEAPEAEAKVVPPANEEMASYFKAQLADAQEKIINLSIENKEMKTKLETIDVTHTQLRAIAMDSINLRSVGLGRGHIDLSTASDEVILSTFSTISKTFNNTFPVGGVTEVASTEKPAIKLTAAQEAAYKAARI